MALSQKGLRPFFSLLVGVGTEIETAQIGVNSLVSRKFHDQFVLVIAVNGRVALHIDDSSGRDGARLRASNGFVAGQFRRLVVCVSASSTTCSSQNVVERRSWLRLSSFAKSRLHNLVQFFLLLRSEIWCLTGNCGVLVEVIEECVWNYTTITGLPYVLFIPFKEPPALHGKHIQDIRSSWRSRFDGTGCVEVAEPQTVRQMGSLQKSSLRILTGLTDLGGKPLPGRHDSSFVCVCFCVQR
mmetsp:Transcript_17268/g.43079  ORF Transcript_17268/g.43079 Transcript_17268/m.43079 type:complete len:241 (+) Transcript_17268:1447-2169(+)